MKLHSLWLMAPIAVLFAGCDRGGTDSPAKHMHAEMSPPITVADAPMRQGERAPYHIDGDRVLVNNRICAVSRTPMPVDSLGTYVSEVEYDGPIEQFRGKRLVFNQCCEMCVKSFPAQWASGRDEIMKFHGLID